MNKEEYFYLGIAIHYCGIMKRKYICIPVMVLMICALFPGMGISGDCESCSTEKLMTYANLQEMISSTKAKIESIQFEVELLEDKIRETTDKDVAMSAANSYINLMNSYIERKARLTQLETIYAHVKETKDGWSVFVSSSLTIVPTEKELTNKFNASEAAFQQVYVMETKLLAAEDTANIRALIIEYSTLVESYIASHVSYLEDYYLVQMSSWEDGRLLSVPPLTCADKTTPLAQHTQHYLTNFAQVRVWAGNYSTSTPNMNSMIDQQCYTYFTMADDYDYYWSRRVDGTNSIHIKEDYD